MEQVSDTQVMQLCVKDPRMPVEIRLNFVKKVYGILIAMLVVSFAIVAPFVFNTVATLQFMEANQWILGLSIVLLLGQQMLNLAMSFEACCGGSGCADAYLRMMKTVPWNYIFLFTYAACFGVLLGFVSCEYKATSVGLVFVLTATIMGALTVFAVRTKQDFTGMGMYMCAGLTGLFLLAIIGPFVPVGSFFHRLVAVAGAVAFSFIIIYDTQLIFGTASFELDRSAVRKIEFSVDMYAYAAYQLYLDFVNMFIYLLELFGERRES